LVSLKAGASETYSGLVSDTTGSKVLKVGITKLAAATDSKTPADGAVINAMTSVGLLAASIVMMTF